MHLGAAEEQAAGNVDHIRLNRVHSQGVHEKAAAGDQAQARIGGLPDHAVMAGQDASVRGAHIDRGRGSLRNRQGGGDAEQILNLGPI